VPARGPTRGCTSGKGDGRGGCVRKSLGQGASVSRLGEGGGEKACARGMRAHYNGYDEEGADESEIEEGRARPSPLILSYSLEYERSRYESIIGVGILNRV
jgi:hypothetical protein